MKGTFKVHGEETYEKPPIGFFQEHVEVLDCSLFSSTRDHHRDVLTEQPLCFVPGTCGPPNRQQSFDDQQSGIRPAVLKP